MILAIICAAQLASLPSLLAQETNPPGSPERGAATIVPVSPNLSINSTSAPIQAGSETQLYVDSGGRIETPRAASGRMSRQEIRSLDILERPYRIGHFYGNTVRRRHH